jgi:predicted permease
MQTFWQDLRYALRLLAKSPGFAAVAILTLAIGIGANTAIFSVIDAVLLRPLPYPHPDQLVTVWNGPGFPLTGPDFLDFQNQNGTFSGMALYSFDQNYNLTGAGEPRYVDGVGTEANFFSVLGAKTLVGRTWAKGEDKDGANHEVILSYGLWQSQFGGDRGIVGKNIDLNEQAYAVVGVMPPQFDFPFEVDLWVPQDMGPKALGQHGEHQFLAVGRMKPGISLDQAQADLAVIAKRLARLYPNWNTGVGVKLFDLHAQLVGGAEHELWFMLAAVGLVLLIACVNVANLLLARSAARVKEMAVRSALGATRGRLVRQLLSESVLLALLGGVVGLMLGWAGLRLLPLLEGVVPPGAGHIALNFSVYAFAFALALATGLLFGSVPGWQVSRPVVLDELKGGAGAALGGGRQRRLAGRALVAAEIAISLMLLVAAGLVMKSFVRLQDTDFGVRRTGILTARVNLPTSKYGDDAKILTFARVLLQRVRHLPGVISAAMTDHLPLNGGTSGTITLYGHPTNKDTSASQWVEMHGVTPGYFQTFAIPLLAGRSLTEEDTDSTLKTDMQLTVPKPSPELLRNSVFPVDINRTMARMFWPGKSPLGQRFSYSGAGGPWLEVVGVVGDTRQWGLRMPPRPEEYNAFDGSNYGGTILVLHTAFSPDSLIAPVRQQVAEIDPNLPLFEVRTMEQVVARQTAGVRTTSLLIGIFASLAILLAAVGIYGVMAHLVTQRTHEIGIRMALGAPRNDILGMVLREGGMLILLGVAAGVGSALALTRFLSSQLYEVKPTDPLTFVAVSLLLALIALAACYIPARRAMRVDPMVALRYE